MKLFARFTVAVFLAVAFLSLTLETSQAQLPYQPYTGLGGGGGFGLGGYGGFGYGLRPSPYSLGQVPIPPYFALHPPVYYSMPVARTYGHSPYAYPGFYRTPEVEVAVAVPATITNPHVTPSAIELDEASELEGQQDDYAVKPLVIDNPYVLDSPTRVDATELASVEYVD